jgi:tRNA pseudouridine38-40 synthase
VGAYKLTIAYDGGPFAGWAVQPGLRTVQGELEAALALVLGERGALTVAGRTDAGVHAWGQVASFEYAGAVPQTLAAALNANLPDQIAVLAAEAAPDGFDARRDARSRTYCYWVVADAVLSPFERGRALHWPRRLDRGALAECAAALVGTHDFTAFTPTDTEHVRFERHLLAAEWKPYLRPGPSPDGTGREAEEPDGLSFWVTADAFMRNMVRALVGTMLEVGTGRRPVEDFAALLEGAPRTRAGDTAPAHGLYLASVAY